jgi:hypothetical protein
MKRERKPGPECEQATAALSKAPRQGHSLAAPSKKDPPDFISAAARKRWQATDF